MTIHALSKKQLSLSGLVEECLKSVVSVSSRRKNILDRVDKLHPDSKIIAESQKKTSFYEGLLH